ncbi:7360_t:CDS:2, partial [Ambispora leptoticha]
MARVLMVRTNRVRNEWGPNSSVIIVTDQSINRKSVTVISHL